MKIGDLVTLSSAGRKSQQNVEVLNKIGLVVGIRNDEYPFKVEWFGCRMAPFHGFNRAETERYGTGAGSVLPMKRYEIKQVKK